jgi:hypothetical protein
MTRLPGRNLCSALLGVLGVLVVHPIGGNHEARAASESLTPEPGPRASRPAKRLALELDGQVVGFLDAVSGGGVRAEVIDERMEPGGIHRKRLGPPRAQEIALKVGLAMDPAFYRWIAQTWAEGSSGLGERGSALAQSTLYSEPRAPSPELRRTGAVLELDDSGAVRARREFVNARLTEVAVPALDVAEKKPGSLTVKILPESIRFVKGEGARLESGPGAPPPPHFVGYPRPRRTDACVWLPCNFRVLLDGLEETRITRVEAFTVKTVANRNAPKGAHDGRPYTTVTPSLSLTITEATADPWFDWLERFTLQGGAGADRSARPADDQEPEQEKNGVILLLSPSRAELARIDLRGVGLCGLTPASTDASVGTTDDERSTTAPVEAGRAGRLAEPAAELPPIDAVDGVRTRTLGGGRPVGSAASRRSAVDARPHVSADLYVQRIGFSASDRPQAEAPTSAPRQPLRFQSILK